MMKSHLSHERDDLIDALRGIAVLGMILAHGIYFLHGGSLGAVNAIEWSLNVVTLTLFIFVSGIAASRFITKYAHISYHGKIAKAVRYVSVIYLAYASVTVIAAICTKPLLPDTLLADRLRNALLLLSPFNFTEYMTLFMMLPFITVLFEKLLKKIQSSTVVLIFAMVFVYTLGVSLYPLSPDGILLPLKEILAGGQSALRFPFLFYLPVFFLGLWWDTHARIRTVLFFTVLSVTVYVLSYIVYIPLLSLPVRWPPSVEFLLTGCSVSMMLYFALKILPGVRLVKHGYRVLVYIGKDALDYWITHLVLLLFYARYAPIRFDTPFGLLISVSGLYILTILISSLAITNTVSFATLGPVALAPLHARRLRKRYILMIILSAVFLGSTLVNVKSNSLYGETLPAVSFGLLNKLGSVTSVTAETNRLWYSKRIPEYADVTISVSAKNSFNLNAYIDPETLRIYADGAVIKPSSTAITASGITVRINAAQFSPGTHTVHAELSRDGNTLSSAPVRIQITEPLLIAWTFDWEGWDVAPDVLDRINSFRSGQPDIVFTHFVNPRTFLDGVMSKGRRSEILAFLRQSRSKNDEIALHLHMQYDLVRAAGVEPLNTQHWGLRSDEGYDVPATAYTPGEFRTILAYAKDVMADYGFSDIRGFRSGGWYISSEQLAVLPDIGFVYDSSGRDKPATGPFSRIPWALPPGVQPYRLDPADQNNRNYAGTSAILEIPDNTVATSELTADEIINRIRSVYAGGVLTQPKAIVVVTHPQFAATEFSKIPGVLTMLRGITFARGAGPVQFVTTGDIYTIWTSYLH
jgi:hypothetical protein